MQKRRVGTTTARDARFSVISPGEIEDSPLFVSSTFQQGVPRALPGGATPCLSTAFDPSPQNSRDSDSTKTNSSMAMRAINGDARVVMRGSSHHRSGFARRLDALRARDRIVRHMRIAQSGHIPSWITLEI